MMHWMILQAAALAGPMLPASKPAPRPCVANQRTTDEVIVCGAGGGQEQFRLRALPERYSADPAALPKAETSILGGKAKLAAETEAIGVGGFQSKRAMVRLKIPLGK